MTDNELDVLMRRVLLDSLKLDWEKEPEPTLPFVPSSSHQRQISAMLLDPLAWERKRAVSIWKKIVRRVAVILLIISLGFSGLIAASPTVRAALVQWITEWYEDHIIYRYTGTDINEEMQQYKIAELPEGYAEDENERIEEPNYIDIVYRNDITGKTIHLEYVYMHSFRAAIF